MLSRIILLVSMILALSCVTKTGRIHADYSLDVGNESVVFGHLSFTDHKMLDFFAKLERFTMNVHNMTLGGEFEIKCDRKGDNSPFHVALPPGRYTMTKVSWGDREARFHSEFTVARDAVVYLGNLECKGIQSPLGSLFGSQELNPNHGWYLTDDYDQALLRLQENYTNLTGPYTKSLLIPISDFETLGSLMKIKKKHQVWKSP